MKTHPIIRPLWAASLLAFMLSCEKESVPSQVSESSATSIITEPSATRNSDAIAELLSKVSFNGEMLVFEDGETFAGVYNYLAEYQPQDDDEPDPTGVAHLLALEDQFTGFQSLRAMVEAEMQELILAESLTQENNPDDNYMADYVLRTLLNTESKVIIAEEEFHLTPEFLGYEEGSDADRGGCCWMYREKNDYIYIPNGTKMIHCKSWVYNIPIPVFWFGVTGSSTRSYWGNPGNLQPTNVNQIRTESPYTYYLITCSGAEGVNEFYTRSNWNASFVTRSKLRYTFTLPFFISERTVNHFADYNGGSDINTDIDFCQ